MHVDRRRAHRAGAARISRARDVDLGLVAQRAIRDEERPAPLTWPGEHYRMLVSLSEEWRNGDSVTVVEIGTFAGASALWI